MAEYLKQEQDAALLTSSETRVIDTSASTDPTQAMSTKDKLERTLSGNDAGTVGDNSGPSFSDSLRDIQHNLDTEYVKFEQNLEASNPRETDLVAFDWHDLETQYEKEVADAALRERQIMDRFNERFKQFTLWMEVSNDRESHRAMKRIRTQSALVQHSEQQLEDQQQHYEKVMEAFQAAMKLFGRPS